MTGKWKTAPRLHIIFVYNKQNDAFGLLYHKIKDIHKLDIELKPNTCNKNILHVTQWCKVDMRKLKLLGADTDSPYILHILFQSVNAC